uniref:Protein FAR1-RELATED SEQUENCE n=1 Tax=Parastrongyloides trichosuri TaxID=131310 RepID=A0A0N4Z008_PARTI
MLCGLQVYTRKEQDVEVDKMRDAFQSLKINDNLSEVHLSGGDNASNLGENETLTVNMNTKETSPNGSSLIMNINRNPTVYPPIIMNVIGTSSVIINLDKTSPDIVDKSETFKDGNKENKDLEKQGLPSMIAGSKRDVNGCVITRTKPSSNTRGKKRKSRVHDGNMMEVREETLNEFIVTKKSRSSCNQKTPAKKTPHC